MKNIERPFKGVWIPAHIWLDENLNITEKCLLAEIDSLSHINGCFASNQHFAEFLGLSKERARKLISQLKDKGYLEIELIRKEGSCEVDKRIIKLIGYGQKQPEGQIRPSGVVESDHCSNTDNNTNNNTVSNKKERKSKSKSYDEQIAEYTQNEELQNALKAFVQMRAFIKKPLTEYGLKLLLNKLSKIGRTDAEKIAIVNRSVEHNWQGFFEIKEETSYQKSAQPEKKYDQNSYDS